MKKSQVLAALALAFALGLGVVVPVANTFAYTAADAEAKPPVQGSATQADVENAIAAIKANPTYANMIALRDTIADYGTDAQDKYADFVVTPGTNSNTTPDVINNLASAFNTGTSSDPVYAFGVSATDISDITGNAKLTLVEQINALVKKATAVKYYDVVAKVEAAVDAKDEAAFRAAVSYYNATFNANLDTSTDNTINSTAAGKGYAGLKTAFDAQTTKLATYDKYVALYDAVEAANTAATKYTNGISAMTAALKASGVMNANGLSALNTALKVKNPTIQSLVDLVFTVSSGTTTYTSNTNNYAGWITLANKVEATAPIDMDSNINYNAIINLATDYKAVTNNTTQSVAQVAAELAKYVAPATRTLTATGAGTTVTAKGAFPADVELKVVKSDDKVAAFGDRAYKMWDIKLVKGNDVVKFEGNAVITINVPEGIDAAKAGIYFVDAEGNVQRYNSTVADGKMTFTTNHLSLWAIVEDNGTVLDTPKAPTTGIVSAEAGATTTVAMVAGLATALTAAGAGVVAYRNARRSTRK